MNILWMHPEDSCGITPLKEAIETAQKKLGKGLVGDAVKKFYDARAAAASAFEKKDWRKSILDLKIMHDQSKGVAGCEALAKQQFDEVDDAALAIVNDWISKGPDDKKALSSVRDFAMIFPETSKTGAAARKYAAGKS